MLGIYTRYQFAEPTYLALRIADWVKQAGAAVSIWTSQLPPRRPGFDWDAMVYRTGQQRFTSWARQCRQLLWTHIPPREQIDWVNKQGVRTLVYVAGDALRSNNRRALQSASTVLCAFKTQADQLRRHLPNEVLHLPWDNGLPPVRRDQLITNGRISLLLPLFDREVFRIETTSLNMLGRLLQNNAHVDLTVCYSSSTLAPRCRRRLKQFRKYFGTSRIRELAAVHPRDRHLVYMHSDLTVWPCCSVGVGMVGLDSLCLGTPLAAFSFAPLTEVLDSYNSVLAFAQSYADGDGMVHVQPCYDDMEQRLHTVLRDSMAIIQRQAMTHTGLRTRRQLFHEALARVVQ